MTGRASRSALELMEEALAHLQLALEYSSEDLSNQLTVDAVCLRLSVGIETLSHLDDETRTRLFGDVWALMWATRNRIAHGYITVDSSIIEATITQDIPDVISRIEGELVPFSDERRVR